MIFTPMKTKKAVKKCSISKSVDNVRSLLGLAIYYRAFVKYLASLASPLTCLLKKDVPLCWHEAQQQSINILKRAVTETPILFPFL